METVVAAAVTGLFTLVGVWVTVRGSRRASLRQHEEQNGQLGVILEHQIKSIETAQSFNHRFDAIENKVAELKDSHEVLFGMVAEVDAKVTKPARKKAGEPKEGI